MIRTVLVTVCLFLTFGCASHRGGAAASPQQASAGNIRVFVTTFASNDLVPSSDQVRRLRTAAVIVDELKGKKGLALVDAIAQADVVVDVQSPVNVFVPRTGTKFDDKAVLVDVRAAGQTTRIVKSGYDRTRTTKNVADDVYRWIQSNHDKIVAARPPAK